MIFKQYVKTWFPNCYSTLCGMMIDELQIKIMTGREFQILDISQNYGELQILDISQTYGELQIVQNAD